MRLAGIEPGLRECHDAQPGKLRVDFAYPGAKPQPIALEVTSLRDDAYLAGVPAAIGIQERLSRIAEEEQLGSWLAAVRAPEKMKALEPEILRLVREGRSIRPGQYTADDLLACGSDQAAQAFMKMHERLKEMGLVELHPWPSRRDHIVGVLPTSGARMVTGFTEALQAAVDDNSAKLAEITGSERHLAVLVGRFDFSGEHDETEVPEIPSGLERLWVVNSYETIEPSMGVWAARPGDTSWELFDA